MKTSSTLNLKFLVCLMVTGLAACADPGKQPATTEAPTAAPTSLTAASTPPAEDSVVADRERDLALRESELAEREAALANREADAQNRATAARPSRPRPAPAATPTPRPAPAPAPAAQLATSAPADKPPAAAPRDPLVVPAGTQLAVALTADITTRTARVGDRVSARLANDLVLEGGLAVASGAAVRGSVTQVVSGSNAVGGTPTLALAFDSLELDSGTSIPISATVVQQLRSETARDTAKIAGGAVAGAVIGHQMDDDKGKVIGGILGGAAGALAAKKTGGNIDLPEGTTLTVTVDSAFEIPAK